MRKSTLRDILVSYERKRDKAESELEYRIKDVYSQIPEIKSIDDEVSKIGLELAKLVLLNPQDKDSIIAQSKDKMHELKLKKEELLNRYNVPNCYLDLQYSCNVCKDKGFLQNGHKCNCLKQEIINEAYKMSNLSRMLENQNFNNINTNIFSDEII